MHLIESAKMEQYVDTTIQFSGLKPGIYNYHYTLDGSFFSEYKNEKILNGKVDFDVKLEKKERLMMFHFVFEGTVRTMCDRCLGELDWPVEGEQFLCVKTESEGNAVQDNSDDETVILDENEHTIDLAQWMYEYVAVAMPIQCIHPDDAEGNPTCDPEMMKYLSDEEQHLNEEEETTDPRWDILKTIKGDD